VASPASGADRLTRVRIARRWIVALGLACVVAISRVSVAQEADVQKAQTNRFAAMMRGDVAMVADYLGDELTYTHSGGDTETKPQFLETLRSGRIKYDQIEPADVKIRMYGQTAVVTGRSTMHVRAGGQAQTFQIRFIEVDVLRDGRWRMVAWQATRLP